MKTPLALLILSTLLLTGCASHYVMTLTNGARIDTRGKPKLVGGFYVYTDATGQKNQIGTGRVAEIAPASMARRSNNDTFQFTPGSSHAP